MSEPREPKPDVVDEAKQLERRGSIDVMQIPRLLGGALTDLRAIAEGMAVLPKLLVSLGSIQSKVDSLDDEVKKMRASVETMGGDVEKLRGPIERLEPHLEDVSRATHPLRRIGARTRRTPPNPDAND